MAKYFSASTVAFYDTDIIDSNNLPEDSVLLTDEEYADLMAQQCAGYVIVAGTDGRPVAMQQICEPCSCLEHDETIATAEKLGHIKIGSGLTVEEDGTVSAQGNLRTINNNLPDETGNITPKQTGCIPMTHITNCITEIPQDINLELSDGTLTLKAGSKVYVPNGFEEDGTTPKFDVQEITSDISRDNISSYTGQAFISLTDFRTDYISYDPLEQCHTNGTVPTSGNYTNYDTSTNVITRYYNGTETNTNISFPLAVVTASSGVITSIDQVFNGFGYIGSTIFCLPNVKGLIPNGRNADGTLNNIEMTIQNVITRQATGTHESDLLLFATFIATMANNSYVYSEQENFIRNTVDNTNYRVIHFGTASIKNGVITRFSPKLPFRAIDHSDKAEVAGWAMPSDRYIDLTLGESRSTYTAPANGYFVIKKGCGTGNILYMWNQNNGMIAEYALNTANSSFDAKLFIPVKKGDSIYIFYNLTGTTGTFRFIYAEGAQ